MNTGFNMESGASKRFNALRLRQKLTPYWFILPTLFVLSFFIAYPVLYSFWLSFHQYQWNMPALGKPFVGLENYLDIFRNRDLLHSARWTVIFTVISVPIECLLGLSFALILNSRVLVGWARNFFRGVFLIPMMLAPVIAAFMWRMMFDAEYGPVNHLVTLFGLEPVRWFTDATSARATVILTDIWLSTPFGMLVLLAGLQGIPEEYYEAARIDGASAWQLLLRVTLPLLKYPIMIVLIIRTMDALRIFDQIYILTGGGPGTATTTVMYYTYRFAFAFYQMGRASAVSFTVLLVISAITFGYLIVLRRSEVD
jgi:multiple sugar transport system permease protein